MTGVLNVMVAGGSRADNYTVTVGNQLSTYGFNPDFGSISSSTVDGATIEFLGCSTQGGAQYDLQITLDGLLDQDFFSTILVQTTAGTYRTFTSASATRTQIGGNTAWTWDSDNPVWTATGTRSMVVIF